MYQKDYILRMVEAFARMIAGIVSLRKEGQLDRAEKLILEAYDTILKINPEALKKYGDVEWERFCSERSPEELEMIAELFRQEGEIRIDSGNPDGVCRLLFRSLELLKRVDSQSDTFSLVRFDRISSLEEKLSGADY